MLASQLYLQERAASGDRSRVYRSLRENSVSSSSHFRESTGRPVVRESTGKPVALCSNRRKSSQEASSDREIFPQNINRFLETMNLYSNSPAMKNLMKSFLEEHSDKTCSQMQNLKCESKNAVQTFLDCSVRDLQRQLGSNRLEIYCTYQGFEESRKEQARLHEELASVLPSRSLRRKLRWTQSRIRHHTLWSPAEDHYH